MGENIIEIKDGCFLCFLTTDKQQQPIRIFSNYAKIGEKANGDWCKYLARQYFFGSPVAFSVIIADANQLPSDPAHLFHDLHSFLRSNISFELFCQTEDFEYVKQIFNYVCINERNVSVNFQEQFAREYDGAFTADDIINWYKQQDKHKRTTALFLDNFSLDKLAKIV